MPDANARSAGSGAPARIDTVWGELVFEPVERSGRTGAETAPSTDVRDGAGDTGGLPNGGDLDATRARAEAHARARRRCASGRPRADRAAQFMPFAALRGYYDLVDARKRVAEPRHDLTDEEAVALSGTLARVRRGQIVRATYYDRDAYVTITGCVARIDLTARTLTIVRTLVNLDDLRELEIVADEASAPRA